MTGDILQSTLRVEGIRSNRLYRHYKIWSQLMCCSTIGNSFGMKKIQASPTKQDLGSSYGFFSKVSTSSPSLLYGKFLPGPSCPWTINTFLTWQFFVSFQAHLKSLFISHLGLATKQCVIFVLMHSGVTTVTRRVQTCADEEPLLLRFMYE